MIDLEPIIDAIAERAAERVLAALGDRSANGGYLDVPQAAVYLVSPKRRIYELVAAGRLRHYRDGRRLLFKPADLDAALEIREPHEEAKAA